jgi:hypothetical protein
MPSALPVGKPSRLHSEGRTFLALGGQYAITAGLADTNGPIVSFSVSADGHLTPITTTNSDDGNDADAKTSALTVARSGDFLALSEPLMNQVGIFSIPQLEPIRIAHRCEIKCHALAVSYDDAYL